jgi:ribonuclease R
VAASPTSWDEFEATVLGHRDGHGFLQRNDGQADVFLVPSEMRAVLHNDRVRARIVRMDRKGRPEGRVTEIIDRPKGPIIGRLLQEAGVWLVAPEDKRYGQDILIPKGATFSADATKVLGKVVVAELTEPPSLHGQPVGRVVEVLGDVDDPGMEIEIAVRKYSVPHEFSQAALAIAKGLPDKVRTPDKKDRVDLTDVPLVTIDGEDARDFDDAVYCEPYTAGKGKTAVKGWRLLVAIADVSHYVQSGNALDAEAFDRATSVYFPRRVIPMLPEKISNGLCSLNPDVDRLCMVCDMVVSSTGEVTAYQFYNAVMHSHARFTYNEVAAILANTRGPESTRRKQMHGDSFDAVHHLSNLHDVYRALLQSRHARGAVDFETTETQIVCDELGRIEKIVPRTRNDAHRLIEEAMLAANVCAADFIAGQKHPSLYRVHEGPTPEKKEVLKAYLKALGVGMSISDDPHPREFAAIAEATRERPDHQQIHTMLLRSMSQAIYTPANSGHFGLAYPAYTHFTSPIRRYPDLLVHRVIKAILARTNYRLPSLPTPNDAGRKLQSNIARRAQKAAEMGQKAKPRRMDPADEVWAAAGLHCSGNERRADEASQDVQAWLKCQYMRNHLGEEFGGAVTAATSFGLFVVLDAMYVEGLVHISELGGDYWRFDEVRQELRGERTGMRYAVGSRVRIQVSRVDLDGRRIDFRLIRDDLLQASKAVLKHAKKGSREAFAVVDDETPSAEDTNPRARKPLLQDGAANSVEAIRSAVVKAVRASRSGGKASKTGKPNTGAPSKVGSSNAGSSKAAGNRVMMSAKGAAPAKAGKKTAAKRSKKK